MCGNQIQQIILGFFKSKKGHFGNDKGKCGLVFMLDDIIITMSHRLVVLMVFWL